MAIPSVPRALARREARAPGGKNGRLRRRALQAGAPLRDPDNPARAGPDRQPARMKSQQVNNNNTCIKISLAMDRERGFFATYSNSAGETEASAVLPERRQVANPGRRASSACNSSSSFSAAPVHVR